MLDEFPALGRLDFFESALAFMAGYGLKSFLIAQSLNQIEKAYGPNNSILDNCHVRVCFASNDERTARRISDALGMATELRAMKNYAGHRLSPWLGHLMVSRQETARPLLTPGEVMQLPPDDELVLVSGCSPIRARKARYFEDERFRERVIPPAKLGGELVGREMRSDDWSGLHRPITDIDETKPIAQPETAETSNDPANSGLRREPELPQHEEIVPEPAAAKAEFDFADEEADDEIQRAAALRKQGADIARQAAMDPGDGLGL
jgi:type IV secretion system protein VirD4